MSEEAKLLSHGACADSARAEELGRVIIIHQVVIHLSQLLPVQSHEGTLPGGARGKPSS